MKKLLFTFSSVCCIAATHAQNLVTNGSFETKDPALGCPVTDGFTYGKPANWDGYISKAGNYLDPDYFVTCAANDGVHNYPGNNVGGCEYPLQGSAYVGFLAFATNLGSAAQSSEYLYSTVSLTSGQQYYVEFYVSNAEGKSANFPSTFYSKRIGMFIWPTFDAQQKVELNQVNGLNQLTPQIPNTFPAANFYTTASGWQKISGTYTATTTGSHNIYIGNFDPGMNVLDGNGNPMPDLQGPKSTFTAGDYVASYYFLDGVTILPINTTVPDYSAKVIGPDILCTTANYILQNQPFGTTVSWSSSNTSGLSISATGSATKISNFNGQVNITANLNGACGTIPISKNIIVGVGISDPLFEQKTVTCISSSQYSILARVTQAADINATYKWYIGSANGTNFVLNNTSTSNSATVGGGNPDNLYHILKVDITNSCGTVSTANAEGRYKASCSGGGGGTLAVIFPNPASSQLSVGLASSTSSTNILKTTSESAFDENATFEVKLFNPFQLLVRTGVSHNGTVDFNVADLQNGIYYLHINTGTEIIRKQVMISK